MYANLYLMIESEVFDTREPSNALVEHSSTVRIQQCDSGREHRALVPCMIDRTTSIILDLNTRAELRFRCFWPPMASVNRLHICIFFIIV